MLVNSCGFFFFPLGLFESIHFLLLEMKTESYNCIHLPVTAALRSTRAKARVASPGSPSQQSSRSQPKMKPHANT